MDNYTPIDTIDINGLTHLRDVEYKGNFNINYHSKEDLKLLQLFFGVRRSKFDMNLLSKRPELLKVLEEYNYVKCSDS